MRAVLLGLFICALCASTSYAQNSKSTYNYEERWAWLKDLEKVDVENMTKEEVKAMIATIKDTVRIDKDKMSSAEWGFVNYYFDIFDKRILRYHGNFPKPGGYPSFTIYVGGMTCDRCVDEVSKALMAIPYVKEVMEVDVKANSILVGFDLAMDPIIDESVKRDLSSKLPKEYRVFTWPEWREPGHPELQRKAEEDARTGQACPIHGK